MPPSTFRDQLRKLESQRFLVPGKGNMYHFYENPTHVTRTQNTDGALNSIEEKSTAAVQSSTADVHETPPDDIEIYINNKRETTNRPEVIRNNSSPMSKDEYLKRMFDSEW